MPVLITIILILTGISVWIGVPPWPFSPAARLFGGIYLSVFFLGMLFSKPTVQKNGKLFMASVIIFLISEGILLGTNAGLPGFAQTFLFNLWAISLIVVMFMFFNTYSKLTRFMSFFSILGKHSYIIYLFHFFILQTLARYFSILSFPIFAGIMVLSILMPLVISVVYSEVAKLFYFPIKSFVSKIVAL
jgi:peptidoglycan/LPS O-acetylase OafA/YrhL